MLVNQCEVTSLLSLDQSKLLCRVSSSCILISISLAYVSLEGGCQPLVFSLAAGLSLELLCLLRR